MRIFIACCGLLLSILSAQAQEVSVPLDTTGKIFVITIELEKKLNLFPDFPGFMEARLYQDSDSAYFLEVLEQRDSTVVRKRVPQTDEQVAELRKQVSTAITMRSPQTMFDQSGRAGLLVNSAILAGGYYGWAYPTVARVEDNKGPAVYFLITGAGIMVPYFLTANANISRATAMMDFYGGSRGIAHGIAMYYALDPKEDSERAPLGWGIIGSLAERVALNQWATHTHMTIGKAAVVGVGGDFGLALSTALVAGHELWNEQHQAKAGMVVLGGSALGLFAGAQLADHGDYTRGDAYVLRGLGFLGAGIPAAIVDLSADNGSDNDDKTASTLATGGAILSLGLGQYLLKDKDFSSSQGMTVLLTELGLATATTAVMVIISDEEESGAYTTAAAIGGTLGFLVGYTEASASARTIRHAENFDFQFNPLPLMTKLPSSGDSEIDHQRNMALHLTYRF